MQYSCHLTFRQRIRLSDCCAASLASLSQLNPHVPTLTAPRYWHLTRLAALSKSQEPFDDVFRGSTAQGPKAGEHPSIGILPISGSASCLYLEHDQANDVFGPSTINASSLVKLFISGILPDPWAAEHKSIKLIRQCSWKVHLINTNHRFFFGQEARLIRRPENEYPFMATLSHTRTDQAHNA